MTVEVKIHRRDGTVETHDVGAHVSGELRVQRLGVGGLERTSIVLTASEVERVEFVGYEPAPPVVPPPPPREIKLSRRAFFGGGTAVSDEPVVTLLAAGEPLDQSRSPRKPKAA